MDKDKYIKFLEEFARIYYLECQYSNNNINVVEFDDHYHKKSRMGLFRREVLHKKFNKEGDE